MFHIVYHQGNAKKNNSEIPLHTYQNIWKSLESPNAGDAVRQQELLLPAGGISKLIATLEDGLAVSYKSYHRNPATVLVAFT